MERTRVSDLSPLKGMKLTALTMCGNPVSDLSPLEGMKLTFLHCGGTKVSDLSPLNGMPLTLSTVARTKVSDASLASIKDCKDLIELLLAGTQVSDAGLAHLKDHKNLKRLDLQGTKVSGLSPLAGHAAGRNPPDPQEHHQPGPGYPPQHEEPQNHRHRLEPGLAGGGILGSLRQGGVQEVESRMFPSGVLACSTETGCPRHRLYGSGRLLPSAAPMADRNVTRYRCAWIGPDAAFGPLTGPCLFSCEFVFFVVPPFLSQNKKARAGLVVPGSGLMKSVVISRRAVRRSCRRRRRGRSRCRRPPARAVARTRPS